MKDFADLEKALESGLDVWQSSIMTAGAKRIGSYAVAEVKRLTPVRTGLLRRRWHARIDPGSGEIRIWIVNNTEYGPAVNYGHRIVRARKTVGKTRGAYMLENGIYNYKRNGLRRDIESMLDDLRRAL